MSAFSTRAPYATLNVMTFLAPIGRLLAFLAVLGLLLGPLASAVSVTAMATPAPVEMADGMPCPDNPPALPDCGKDCPLVALCLTAFTLAMASPDESLLDPSVIGSRIPPHGYSPGTSLHHEPHPRPPKA
ncbi:hypothetical protein [Mesorhizobium sp.]|uniref:hypothetical protein n=1 Tax=Mesorhizobium sp. TaxID=1871066 RepID=UPI000FE4A27F|nr:hypothetical protein [Mesorhizobium sp.]RWA97373.1 MAG: hypothetical protein EOQ33_31770 [Mesorhizobium sp.]